MNALALALLALVVWTTWPLARTPRARWGLLALAVFLPAAWLILVPLGIRHRYRNSRTAGTFTAAAQEIDQRREEDRHRRDVTYWRGLLETGTPVEKAAAEDLLAYWGEPLQLAPVTDDTPVTDDETFSAELTAALLAPIKPRLTVLTRVVTGDDGVRRAVIVGMTPEDDGIPPAVIGQPANFDHLH